MEKLINYLINLIENQQAYVDSIYNLGKIRIQILKTNIKTRLVNGFMQVFNLSLIYPIFLLKNLIKAFVYV